ADDPHDDLDARRLQQRVPADGRRSRRPDARARDPRHPLPAAGPGRPGHGLDRDRAAARAAARVLHDEEAFQVKLNKVLDETRLILIGIPVFLWTMIPVYHLFVLSISPRESVTAGRIWPDHPTLHNFGVVFREEHFYLTHFW